jgi:ABC-type multidrug transport system ATPase subunit
MRARVPGAVVSEMVDMTEAPRAAAAVPVEASGIRRRFRDTVALDGASIRIPRNSIHALLGPNGAGKTTLIRVLTGLVEPDEGEVRLMGIPLSGVTSREIRRLFGFVPSGDRTFYLRISATENLVFFGRLYGLSRKQATVRAGEVLEAVELTDAAKLPVGVFSHGMQKRLSLARALLLSPPILFVDEATHDLDPEASARARGLVADAARAGAAVVWTTQRVDEIRGFADRVTLLDRGVVRFEGTVPELMGTAGARRFLLHLARDPVGAQIDRVTDLLEQMGSVLPAGGEDGGEGDGEHLLLVLQGDAVLGDAIAKLADAGIRVVACREERSGIEEAFLRLTGAG